MAVFTKKLGQLKQWTGEKFGSTGKTQKPAEIKQLQNETKSRFEGLDNIKSSLKSYSKGLDDNRNSTMSLLAHAFSAHSAYHEDTDFGILLMSFGTGLAQISANQNLFSEEIRLGLLMAVESVLNETKEFDRLRTKLKNRRLDHDANYNKLQKSSKGGKDVHLEEKVQTTSFKYQETLKKLEDLMTGVARQEIALIDPMIEFLENQVNFHQKCLEASQSTLKALKEGKEGLKAIDYTTMSFRKELERDDFEEVELALKPESDIDSDRDSCSDSQSESLNAGFVSLSLPSSTPTSAIEAVKKQVKAKYSFVAENDNEMSFNKGDIIGVLKEIDEGWWLGQCNDQKGLFPSNYIVEISEMPLIGESKPEAQKETVQKQSAQPGFSYLPPGAPITFIGRKKQLETSGTEQDNAAIDAPSACSQCDCDDFCANVFKPGHCNNCFHKH